MILAPGVIIAVVVAIVVAIGFMVLYNSLVSARQRVREAWSAIDVQLQRRASLIPNLVEAVKGYAAYERGTMIRVVEARSALGSASGPRQAAQANDELSGALRSVFALAEGYPDLKANERFAQLQADLADTENKIAYARNYYNGAVETYNIRVQSVPGVLVARTAGFAPAEFFTADGQGMAR
ncbi:MAG TPA: LemA family protein [Vicinamibacterales bacterium]|nr:LemA family protein [Vicinamibacterales bacterium]